MPNTEESIEEFGPIELEMTVQAAQTVQAPVDDTLSIAGEAADAKATGDAIADLSADVAQLMGTIGIEAPTTDGQYYLRATVSNETVTFAWVADA